MCVCQGSSTLRWLLTPSRQHAWHVLCCCCCCISLDGPVLGCSFPCLLFSSSGRIGKIRLLGDLQHSTRIAFIEFIEADAAMAALNCSGALLGE